MRDIHDIADNVSFLFLLVYESVGSEQPEIPTQQVMLTIRQTGLQIHNFPNLTNNMYN